MPPKLRSSGSAEEHGRLSAGSEKPVEEVKEEIHMTEDGADLMALCSRLGLAAEPELLRAMASAELVTARNDGAELARLVKMITGGQLARSSKLVDTAVRGKKFEHALRLLATHAREDACITRVVQDPPGFRMNFDESGAGADKRSI